MTSRKRADSSGAASQLRKLMEEDVCVVTPGCYDALSARIAENVGFKALTISGFSVEASLLGYPDLGLITLTELADHAARIAGAVAVPITCDVETGFGGVHNIARMIREMENAGIAGIQIEDQITPKRCPLLEGRTLVSIEDQITRLKVACEARSDDKMVIIARSDADVISYDELVLRCNRYLQAGADVAMPIPLNFNGRSVSKMSPDDQMEFYARLPRDIDGPVKGLLIPKGYTAKDMANAGYKLLGLPALSIEAAAGAMLEMLSVVLKDGTGEKYFSDPTRKTQSVRAIMEMMHLDEYLALENRFP